MVSKIVFLPDHLVRRTIQLRLRRSDMSEDEYPHGTGFVIDVDDTQCVLTASHVIPVSRTDPYVDWSIEYRRRRQWRRLDYQTHPRFTSQEEDLAFIILRDKIANSDVEVSLGVGAQLGQEVLIAGFPKVDDMTDGSNLRGFPYPHVRRGSIESWTVSPRTYLIDGFVAPGYSGGPVIKLDPEEEKLQLLGIVSSIDTGDPGDGDKLFPIVDENRFPIEGKFYLYPQGIVKAFAVDDIADHISHHLEQHS